MSTVQKLVEELNQQIVQNPTKEWFSIGDCNDKDFNKWLTDNQFKICNITEVYDGWYYSVIPSKEYKTNLLK